MIDQKEIKRACDNLEAMVEETILTYGVSEQKARLILKDQLRREKLFLRKIDCLFGPKGETEL